MVDLLGVFGGSLGKVINILPGLFLLLGFAGVIGFGIYTFILKPKKFPLVTVLYERINGRPLFAGIDRAGMFRYGDGEIDYKFMKRKGETIQPVDYEILIPSKKGANCLHLIKVSDKTWFPININDMGSTLQFDPVEVDMRNWHLQMNNRLIRKFTTPNWWKEHKAEVVFIMAIIGTFILYFMMWKYAPATITAAKTNAGGIVGTITEVANPSKVPM